MRGLERELAELQEVERAAVRYVREIYEPNIKEPFSIANRRADLVDAVRARQARSARRAA